MTNLVLFAAGLAALVIGFFVVRTQGIYFIMVTMAFAQMVFFLFFDNKALGGSDGIYVYFKPDTSLGGTEPLFDLENKAVFFYFTLAVLVGVLPGDGAGVFAPETTLPGAVTADDAAPLAPLPALTPPLFPVSSAMACRTAGSWKAGWREFGWARSPSTSRFGSAALSCTNSIFPPSMIFTRPRPAASRRCRIASSTCRFQA